MDATEKYLESSPQEFAQYLKDNRGLRVQLVIDLRDAPDPLTLKNLIADSTEQITNVKIRATKAEHDKYKGFFQIGGVTWEPID
jgi:hypothetical protein